MRRRKRRQKGVCEKTETQMESVIKDRRKEKEKNAKEERKKHGEEGERRTDIRLNERKIAMERDNERVGQTRHVCMQRGKDIE